MVVDQWVAVGSIASALVAAFTGWLAWSTRNLATETKRLAAVTAELGRDTVAATFAAERHHKEEMRPLLLLDAQLVVRAKSPRESGFDYQLSLEGDLCNFGGGAATHIVLVVMPHSQVPKEFSLGIIGPNTRNELKGRQWTTWATAGAFELGYGWPFESVLGYSNVAFTRKAGTTKQASPSGNSADLQVVQVVPTDSTEPGNAGASG
jgi:hypothetical protein